MFPFNFPVHITTPVHSISQLATAEPSATDQTIHELVLTFFGFAVITAIVLWVVKSPRMQRTVESARAHTAEFKLWYHQSLNSLVIKLSLTDWNRLLDGALTEVQRIEQITQTSTRHLGPRQLAVQGIRQMISSTAPAAQQNIKKIFDEHIIPGKILELGSSLLNAEGKSYLTLISPDTYHSRFTYSDVERPPLPATSSHNTPYLELQPSELTKKLPKASRSNIVSLSYFDSISRAKLPAIVHELHEVLKPGGKVIILSDILFYEEPLVVKYATPENIILPQITETMLGIKIISRSALREAAQYYGEDFCRFLDKLFEISHDDLFKILKGVHQMNNPLYSILSTICPPEAYEIIEHTNSYVSDLRSAFEGEPGFTIRECRYREEIVVKTDVIARSQTGTVVNEIISDLRIPLLFKAELNLTIPRNMLKISSTLFVFVAEKTG